MDFHGFNRDFQLTSDFLAGATAEHQAAVASDTQLIYIRQQRKTWAEDRSRFWSVFLISISTARRHTRRLFHCQLNISETNVELSVNE